MLPAGQSSRKGRLLQLMLLSTPVKLTMVRALGKWRVTFPHLCDGTALTLGSDQRHPVGRV